MNITLITSWNAVCGVSEFAYFLVGALEAQGHKVTILANRFHGDYKPIGCRTDGPNVIRCFDTGHTPAGERKFAITPEVLAAHSQTDAIILNYQDFLFPCKAELNQLADLTFALGRLTIDIPRYAILHDTAISPEINWSRWVFLVPRNLERYIGQHPHHIMEQGIPEFGPEVLTYQAGPIGRSIRLAVFGLGRSLTTQLVEVLGSIRTKPDANFHLTIFSVQPDTKQMAETFAKEYGWVHSISGYLDTEVLAGELHSQHAVCIWYPRLDGVANSSAFRFAIGAKVPIISNGDSGWISDYHMSGVYWEALNTKPESWSMALRSLFLDQEMYDTERAKMLEAQRKAIEQNGWSKVATQLIADIRC